MDYSKLSKTRKEALAVGSKLYFTGAPCKNGHVSPKRTSSYACVACDKLHSDKYVDKRKEDYARDPEKFKSRSKAYYSQNPDKVKTRTAEYKAENAGRYSQLQKTRYENNKPEILATNRQYRSENRARCNALSAKYRGAKIERTPEWLTKADNVAMLALYEQARLLTKETGIEHHVDHIVPLQGSLVSGLHVPWNLQVLTASENLSKSNNLRMGAV